MTHIAFDADDTLWANEDIFEDGKAKCLEILAAFVPDHETLSRKLYAHERHNLAVFGYGVKGFTLSMMETAIEISKGAITGSELQKIIDVGKEMLAHPVELLPDVEDTIKLLRDKYTLLLITKGDLFDQENKIARSGIADLFDHVEIVSEKTPEAYRFILNRYGIRASEFLMIGNSAKSDILPVLEIGAHALHIPYSITWVHERVESPDHPNYRKIDRLTEIHDYL